MNQYIEVFIHPGEEMSFIDHGGYESRNPSTITLFKAAYELIKGKRLLKVKHFYINTGDVSSKINDTLTYGYTNSKNVIVCPDFIFDRYVECGIKSYEETVRRIIRNGDKKYSIDKLFWTGNLSTQSLRYELYKLGMQHKDKMEIVPMNWKRVFPRGQMHNFTNYTSPEDQTKYKYLIDCGAGGYSGRVKLLLHTNRPLFLVNRDKDKQEFFFSRLVPYEHFIPVKEDLSDLISQLNWAERNYDQTLAIAGNAKRFALENLNKKSVIHYLSGILQ